MSSSSSLGTAAIGPLWSARIKVALPRERERKKTEPRRIVELVSGSLFFRMAGKRTWFAGVEGEDSTQNRLERDTRGPDGQAGMQRLQKLFPHPIIVVVHHPSLQFVPWPGEEWSRGRVLLRFDVECLSRVSFFSLTHLSLSLSSLFLQ